MIARRGFLVPVAFCLVPCSLVRVGRGLSLPFAARRLGEESPDTIRQRAARKGGGWRRKPPVTESVAENIPPCGAICAARVKRRGKSSPLRPQGRRQDKPHAVQDRTEERPAWPQSRASGRNPSGISRTPRKRGSRAARLASREMTATPPAMAGHRIRLTPADPPSLPGMIKNLFLAARSGVLRMLMQKLFVATGNRHKTDEIRAMLGAGWVIDDLSTHPHLPQPEETGATFAENAAIKALAASRALPGMLVLSDDSGLEVDVLGGAPGVKSARYAGEGASDADNRKKLKGELDRLSRQGVAQPFTGRFRCCMCLAKNDASLGVFDGSVEGRLLLSEEGAGGFGYDPLFVPDGFKNSFGVLPAETKNSLSHRARALAKVAAWLASTMPAN